MILIYPLYLLIILLKTRVLVFILVFVQYLLDIFYYLYSENFYFLFKNKRKIIIKNIIKHILKDSFCKILPFIFLFTPMAVRGIIADGENCEHLINKISSIACFHPDYQLLEIKPSRSKRVIQAFVIDKYNYKKFLELAVLNYDYSTTYKYLALIKYSDITDITIAEYVRKNIATHPKIIISYPTDRSCYLQ